MNKKKLWIFPLLLLISIIPIIIKNMPEGKFYLEDKYYGKNQFVDITSADLNTLIKEKESFALFVYQPACVTSADFEQVLYDFMETNNIQIYKISFSDLKETEIKNTIKYYPSFAVFNKGKMVDYLDANSDEDLKYYKSKEGFTKWFQNHVIIKETKKQIENQANSTNTKSTSTSNSNNNTNEETKSTQNQNINLENVTRDNNKVNIYFIKSDRGANGFIAHCISAANCFDTNEIRWENAVNGKLILRHFVYANRITNFIFTGRIISIKLNFISSRTCYRAPGNQEGYRRCFA